MQITIYNNGPEPVPYACPAILLQALETMCQNKTCNKKAFKLTLNRAITHIKRKQFHKKTK